MSQHTDRNQMLVPSLQASDLQQGLTTFLTTTFALTEDDTRQALETFLRTPESNNHDGITGSGIFKGPYIRTRMPFAQAPAGWEERIDWLPTGFKPYGHQAASFVRLSSKPEETTATEDAASVQATWRRPQPTMVTTGTGSGKTESFLMPIIDHVLRANKNGVTGTKALILYPMNALANDQAQRLAETIVNNNLPITAALYTGEQKGSERSSVTQKGLITDRNTIRSTAPDIILTNYKMLDMLLLRPHDAKIWKQSAFSLQYIVLDEFHTYDGAQGTDVAMLLRRLGLTLKRNWTEDALGTVTDNRLDNRYGIAQEDLARPLGKITPVATSATLGAKGDPDAMLDFARTVFGEEFTKEAVVTESRKSQEEWLNEAIGNYESTDENVKTLESVIYTASEVFSQESKDLKFDVNPQLIPASELADQADKYPLGAIKHAGLRAVLYDDLLDGGSLPELIPVHEFLAHEYVHEIIKNTQQAIDIYALSTAIVPENKRPVGERNPQRIREIRTSIISTVLSGLSIIRKEFGREMPSVEIHQWVRELSRINRKVGANPQFSWTEDQVAPEDQDELFLPAIFCRNCGRSGWGIEEGRQEDKYDVNPARIREASVRASGEFRPLIYAPTEGDTFIDHGEEAAREELLWFHIDHHALRRDGKELTQDFSSTDWENNRIIPVLSYRGLESAERSKKQECPACNANDSIRFVGSAIATMLSVTISTLFGSSNVAQDEKKALIFTDSVQDAAHRAGFVQARSHTMTQRATFKTSLERLGKDHTTLKELARETIDFAQKPEERYQLLDPSIANRSNFKPFWSKTGTPRAINTATRYAKRRVAFDATLEFGLNSRMGRTLELTGSATAHVNYGSQQHAIDIIDAVLKNNQEQLETTSPDRLSRLGRNEKIQWLTGVLERIRMQGGIYHDWLKRYIDYDGATWFLQGGRPKNEGMPGFGGGRPMPTFPRIGEETSNYSKNLDNAVHRQSWYVLWTSKVLGVPVSDATFIVKDLFNALVDEEILGFTQPVIQSNRKKLKARVFWIAPERISLFTTTSLQLVGQKIQLSCQVCKMALPGTPQTIDALDGAPCFVSNCSGTLERVAVNPDNYYRKLYSSPDTLRVVAREHTSLLPNKTRLKYEDGFKGKEKDPDAPNVLVATPTLEMGIDIGDLSTVMLSSLPKTVANYQQRIGRSGRLTGNSLVLTYVRARGENLHKLADPLETINGEVKPPATFLNAEEMLRRQYIASIIDEFTANGTTKHIIDSGQLFRENQPGTLLYDIKETQNDSNFYVERFIEQFRPLLEETTCENLKSWASTEVQEFIVSAVRAYKRDVEEIKQRKESITNLLPELEEKARLFAESDSPEKSEAESDLRKARANLKFFTRQLGDLRSEYWISNLEMYGVLPNYTLLDDSVELSVDVTTWDPETSERNTDVESFVRGASTALAEFAPGNTFYANALEIKIDAVELGPDQSNIQRWQICPSCGWSTVLTNTSAGISTCPQCATNINDVNQIFDVVEMRKVSSSVERDEATISDRNDDRKRKFFTVVPTVSTDANYIGKQWSLESPDFGVDSLRRVTLRWINLGVHATGGTSRTISGDEYPAPLFRLCPECGVLDKEGGSNRPDEHRFWCSLRKEFEDHSQPIALGRTLTTQGVQLHLPMSIQYDGAQATPSLKAAVLLGMRKIIGGSPDHIDILETRQMKDGARLHSLLLHDKVPGGTGYLSEFGSPEKVWEVLKCAYLMLRDSECGCLTACHQCLLPYAPISESDLLSRQSAVNSLRTLLKISDDSTFDAQSRLAEYWDVKENAFVPSDSPESVLESKFSYTLAKRLQKSGNEVKIVPREEGNELHFKIHSNEKTTNWTLQPQPQGYANTRPDFKLTTPNPSIPDVLIYMDSKRWHASAATMRVTDDAHKRHRLREQGEIVWAVTHDDVRMFESGAQINLPWGMSQQSIEHGQKNSKFEQSLQMIRLLRLDAMSMLWEWILDPDQNRWRRFSQTVPMYVRNATWRKQFTSEKYVAQQQAYQQVHGMLKEALVGYLDETGTPLSNGKTKHQMWGLRNDFTALCFDLKFGDSYPRPAIFLRGSADDAETEQYQDEWKHWLRYSNLLAFNPELIVGTSQSTFMLDDFEEKYATPAPEVEKISVALSAEWSELISTMDSEIDGQFLINALQKYAEPDLTVPELSYEYGASALPVTYWEETDTVLYLYEDEQELEELKKDHPAHLFSAVSDNQEAVDAAVQQALATQK